MDLVLIVSQIIIAVLLIGVILLQKTSTDSIASIGGGANSMNQSGNSGNVLQKITMWLAAIFMINSLGLSVVLDKKNNESIISTKTIIQQEEKNNAAPENKAEEKEKEVKSKEKK